MEHIKFKNLENEMNAKGWTVEDFAAVFEVENEEMMRKLSGTITLLEAETIGILLDKPAPFLFMENFD